MKLFSLESGIELQRFTFNEVKDGIGNLRQKAYQSKYGNATGLNDEFDLASQHICAIVKDEIIGSVRVMYHQNDDLTDRGRYVSLPNDLLPLSRGTEASRLCTSPDHRGKGLAVILMMTVVLETLRSGRRFTWGGAAGSMLDFYKRFGYRSLGLTYSNDALESVEHELILLDCSEFLRSMKLPEEWLLIGMPVADEILRLNIQ